MAPQQTDLRPVYEDAGAAFAVSAGAGAGVTMTLGGLFHREGRRFLGGLALITLSLLLGLGYAIEEEMRREEERSEDY